MDPSFSSSSSSLLPSITDSRNVRRNLPETREYHSRTPSDALNSRASHHRTLSSYGPQESRIPLVDQTGNFVNPYDSQSSRVSVEERRKSWMSFEEPNESRVSLINHGRISSYDTHESRPSSEFDPYNLVEPNTPDKSWFNPYGQQGFRVTSRSDIDRRISAENSDSSVPTAPTDSRRPRVISASSFRRSWPANPDAPTIAVRPTRPPHSRRTVRRSLPSSHNHANPSDPLSVRSRLNSAPTSHRRASQGSHGLSISRPTHLSTHSSLGLYSHRYSASTPSLGRIEAFPRNPRTRKPSGSVASNFSRDSVISISSDSKYPLNLLNSVYSEQELLGYLHDPVADEALNGPESPGGDELMHDLRDEKDPGTISVIGFFNILTLIAMTLAMLTIFVIYPILIHHQDNTRNTLIAGNNMVNSSGQVTFALPGQAPNVSNLVDNASPQSALSFVGTDNHTYDLVFSNEFNWPGVTFGGDPSTVSTDDLSFVARNDDQSLAQEIKADNGTVVFKINASTTPGQFVSGVLDSQIPFCLGRGFVMIGLLMRDGTEGKLFWAGDSWYHTDSAPDDFVPVGAISNEDITLTLSFGILANTIPNGTPRDQLPSSVAVDFVRYYDRRVDSFKEVPDACNVKKSVKKQTTLNLLNIPGLQG